MIEKILELIRNGYSVEFCPGTWKPTLRITVGKDDFYCSREISFDELECFQMTKHQIIVKNIEELVRRCEQ